MCRNMVVHFSTSSCNGACILRVIIITFTLLEPGESVTIPWPQELQDRHDLVCTSDETVVSNQPGHQTHFADSCICCCEGFAVWERSSNDTIFLHVEFIDTEGHSILLSRYSNSSSYPYHVLRYTNNMMSSLPVNIEDFKLHLVLIDLSYNRLHSLENLNKLTVLDTLNLTGNLLTALSNSTFLGMKHLRILDLSHNNIIAIPPSLLDDFVTLMKVNFDDNRLNEIDGTNIVVQHPFCEISYQENSISEVTNNLKEMLNMSLAYGPGNVKLSHNSFESFFDFDKLGVTDISQIGRLLSFDIEITNINWTCDCHMVPFLQIAQFTLKGGWMGSDRIKCYNPVNLRGESITELVRNDKLDLFNCTLTEKEHCPRNCTCLDLPSQDRLIINCKGLHEALPTSLPKSISNKIEMYMASNSLKVLNFTNYLSRVSVLDLSNNDLNTITESAALAMKNVSFLSLHHNENLRELPMVMKDMDPTRVVMGNKTINCDCSTDWIGDWVRVKGTNNSDVLKLVCNTAKGRILAKDFQKEFLDCIPENLDNLWLGLILAFISVLFVIVGVLAFVFRYEIYLIFRYAMSMEKNNVCPTHKYDVFVSIDEENDPLIRWVRNYLLPFLETSGYSVYLPFRQLFPGEAKQDAILKAIQQSSSFLYVISESSDSDIIDDEASVKWNNIEWQFGWITFKKDRYRNIVLINFDRLETSDIKIKSLRAFVRLRLPLDIADRERVFYKCLKKKLGKPQTFDSTQTENTGNVDVVTNTHFRTSNNNQEVLI